jgi:hypothetical protein
LKIYRLRPYQDARQGPTVKPSLWRRLVQWLNPPRKADLLSFKNPTQWKLDRIRRKAREGL